MNSENMYSIEAEMSALGAAMLSPRAHHEICRDLKPEMFHRPAHRIVFSAMRNLIGKGMEADMVTMEAELRKFGGAQNIGGEGYLLEISEYVPSPAGSAYYVELIREAHERRTTFERAKQLAEACKGGAEMAEIRSMLQAAAESVGERGIPLVEIGDVDSSGSDGGVSSGFPSLDANIGTRGYPSGQMSMVVAQAKGGKSTFMLSSAAHACREGKRVLYATLADLNAKRLKRRMLRNVCGFSDVTSADRHGAVQEFQAALSEIDLWDLVVYDASKIVFGSDVDRLCARIETENERQPIDLVFIDYAQKLTTRDAKLSDQTGTGDLCSTKIAAFAERTGLAVVVGSQLTEANKKEGRAAMTKGSRKWLEDAGWVLQIERAEGRAATVEITYSRFGPMHQVLPFMFHEEHLRFEEAEFSTKKGATVTDPFAGLD